jgi:hydrogenase assembly chaperone HypC/HupF
MCIAVPAKVLAVDGHFARVARGREELQVSLALLDDVVAPGDYLVLQAQRYAVARLDAGEAAECLRLLAEALGDAGIGMEELDHDDR